MCNFLVNNLFVDFDTKYRWKGHTFYSSREDLLRVSPDWYNRHTEETGYVFFFYKDTVLEHKNGTFPEPKDQVSFFDGLLFVVCL